MQILRVACLIIATIGVSLADPLCELPTLAGPCKGGFQRFAFSPDKKECVKFIYGGCRGNANNFVTKVECEQRCKK